MQRYRHSFKNLKFQIFFKNSKVHLKNKMYIENIFSVKILDNKFLKSSLAFFFSGKKLQF